MLPEHIWAKLWRGIGDPCNCQQEEHSIHRTWVEGRECLKSENQESRAGNEKKNEGKSLKKQGQQGKRMLPTPYCKGSSRSLPRSSTWLWVRWKLIDKSKGVEITAQDLVVSVVGH